MKTNKISKELYYIIEVANTHGGNLKYLESLIAEFAPLENNFGIKFQPLQADSLAISTYEWFDVYKKLEFSEVEWEGVINLANQTKDVWLDIFDQYGVKILNNNLDKIHGIKFQSSVLYNLEVINALMNINLSDINLILNIAAREIEEIELIIARIKSQLNPKNIILEFGFQSYPTSLVDSGLSKISELKRWFSNKLVFADHVDGSSSDAIWLPVLASTMGVDIIEKHVRLNQKTDFDKASSVIPKDFYFMVEKCEEYSHLKHQAFINQKEIQYLEKTLMSPILNKDLTVGDSIAINHDLSFRRTNTPGLAMPELERMINNGSLLTNNKKKGEGIKMNDLKKRNVATIIACRLKSSRLPKKALLKIGNLTSVEYCISNALNFENVQHTILATSTEEEDSELSNYTFSPSVIFHKGDPEDVVQRYLDICEKLHIDTFVRVTADMPFIDNEICQILLNSHYKSGADYTVAKEAAVGTNLEIINVKALKEIKKHFPNAEYSEYMTWYFQNNSDYFQLNYVDLPNELVREYRLTLDYQEDLDMFNAIDKNICKEKYSIRDVFNILDKNPNIAEINRGLKLKYKTDQDLIKILNKKTKIEF